MHPDNHRRARPAHTTSTRFHLPQRSLFYPRWLQHAQAHVSDAPFNALLQTTEETATSGHRVSIDPATATHSVTSGSNEPTFMGHYMLAHRDARRLAAPSLASRPPREFSARFQAARKQVDFKSRFALTFAPLRIASPYLPNVCKNRGVGGCGTGV